MMSAIDSRWLRRFVVRIERVDRTGGVSVLGTGFFVAPGWVLTAAHVVDGLDRVAVRPADPTVGVTAVAAEVAARSAPPASAGLLWPFPDMALLRLIDELDHPCVLLKGVDPAGGADCHAWGYPQRVHGAEPVGEPAMFGFEGVDRDGFLQLRQGLARPGLSGAPLVCPIRRAVVGVIVASRDIDLPVGGWAAPISALLAGGPDVPDELAALGSQIAWFNRVALLGGGDSWDRVLPPNDTAPVPEVMTLRRAYRLGAHFALLARLEAGPPSLNAAPRSEERDQKIRSYKLRCKDLCESFSIPFPFETPDNAQRTEIIISRVQHSHQLEGLISQGFGTGVAAAFRFGFELGLSPEMTPHLPPDQRTEHIRRIASHAARAGLPSEIVDRVTAFLNSATDSSTMLKGVFDLNEEASRWWFERLDLNDPWLRSAYSTIWQFVRNAALTVIMHARDAPDNIVASFFRKARRFGDELNVAPPPLFELTGNDPQDHAEALHYVIGELPDVLTARLDDYYGPGSRHALRMGTRLWTLLVMYHPEDNDLGQIVASIVEEESTRLGILRDVYDELVNAIRSGRDFHTVLELILKFDHAITAFLSRPQPSQRCRVCTWRCSVCGAEPEANDGNT